MKFIKLNVQEVIESDSIDEIVLKLCGQRLKAF